MENPASTHRPTSVRRCSASGGQDVTTVADHRRRRRLDERRITVGVGQVVPKCSSEMARPAALAAARTAAMPAVASSIVSPPGSQPSARRPARANAAGLRPPTHTSSGSWVGRESSDQAVDLVAGPPRSELRQVPVDPDVAVAVGQALGPPLGGIVEAGDHRHQQPPARERVELGQRLGQRERVATRTDQVRAELEPRTREQRSTPARPAGRRSR